MARCQYLTDLIDERVKRDGGTPRNLDKGLRHHLGASIIGRPCNRELYMSFRWTTRERFEGRVLRLFDRGHEEESRMVEWLELAGAEILTIDPATITPLFWHIISDSYLINPAYQPDLSQYLNVTAVEWHIERVGAAIPKPRQFMFAGVQGHFGGSLDGKARRVPYQVEHLGCGFNEWILVEFKTHGEKSFIELVSKNDLRISKPEHYAQMVIYMDEHKLPGGLYGAVNKNTDELYWEFVLPNPEFAETIRQKAITIIHATKMPVRISNSPSWYTCRYCTHRQPCHYGVPLVKSCRTCESSLPVDGGRWLCQRFNKLIPKDFEPIGCDFYKTITD